MIETDCSWGVPLDTWTNDIRHHLTEEEKKDTRKPYAEVDYPDLSAEESFLEKEPKTKCRTTAGRDKIE